MVIEIKIFMKIFRDSHYYGIFRNLHKIAISNISFVLNENLIINDFELDSTELFLSILKTRKQIIKSFNKEKDVAILELRNSNIKIDSYEGKREKDLSSLRALAQKSYDRTFSNFIRLQKIKDNATAKCRLYTYKF